MENLLRPQSNASEETYALGCAAEGVVIHQHSYAQKTPASVMCPTHQTVEEISANLKALPREQKDVQSSRELAK